jgi:uncharacterized protein with GYD domain
MTAQKGSIFCDPGRVLASLFVRKRMQERLELFSAMFAVLKAGFLALPRPRRFAIVEEIAMQTFIMLTRLGPEAAPSPKALEDLERQAMERVRKECPGIEWVKSYAILGAFNYLDIFKAEDIETASKVSTLIRTFGHAHTEIWPATEWNEFKEIVRSL